jgi:ABC-2 type transport system permease protein
VYYVVQASVSLVFEPSFERLMEHVRLGTLDFTLLKPASAQFLVSVRHLRIVRIADLFMGVCVFVVGLFMIGSTLTLTAALTFALTLAAGVAAVYALLLTLVTLAFWWVRIENLLAIFWAFTDAGRFPVDVYPGWLRFTLSTFVPIGIAVTVPAQALAGRLTGETLGFMVVGASGSIAFASWFWRRGLKSYTGASA